MRKYPGGLPERLFANSIAEHTGHVIDGEPSECWLWIGNTDRRGYGRLTLRIDGRHCKVRAYRLAAELLAGAKFDNENDTWEHHCRQPACIHPNHGEPMANAKNAGGRRNPGRTR